MDLDRSARKSILVCILLACVTLGTFWPVIHCNFVILDDPHYVTSNPAVLSGLSLQGTIWAFRTGWASNWHPLTWLSHMADIEFFGMNPAGHHFTNLLLHTANVLLLFWFLQLITERLWPSAVVAALFALHPLHVESVAWVSERKDVLSTFFALLCLGSYARNAREMQKLATDSTKPSLQLSIHRPRNHYRLALLFFALSLMSKPMFVTLPFLMLLLDYWPLKRIGISGIKPWLPLLWEKVPFLVLTVISSIVTFLVQRAGGAMELSYIPLGSRLANALISYVRYVAKMFWPFQLAALYPYQQSWPVWETLFAALIVLALSLAALRFARQKPFLAVGWFWYIGMLVPVIGIVQVGEQSLADRYTYFPLLGLFIALVWALTDLSHRWRWSRPAFTAIGVLLLATFSLCTRNQIRYWRTSMDLLSHTLQVAGGSALIHNNMGVLLEGQNDLAGAKEHFAEALRLEPSYDRARYNLARILATEGNADQAASEIRGMSRIWELEAHQTLAKIFLQQSKTNDAISQWLAAIPLDPTNAALRESLGLHLAQQGKTAEASKQFASLVELRPDAEAHYYLALSLVAEGKTREATEHYQNALRLKPDWPEPLNDLAWILATDPHPDLRNGPEAVRLAERACALSNRREARFLGTLDAAYAEAGRFQDAITQCDQTIKLAVATGQQEIGDLAAKRLELYRARRPFHQL